MSVSGTALQGLREALGQLENSASRVASAESTINAGTPVENVDPAQETVTRLSATNQFEATITALKVYDQIQKATIDLVG